MKSKIKNQISKIAFGLLMAYSLWLMVFVFAPMVKADTVTDSALEFLRDKQDETGEITGGGFSNASTWAAIAFSEYGINISSIKHPTNSLVDYLITKQPNSSSSAFEWEKWILAIVAGGYNPYGFSGVDYITTLKSAPYYDTVNHQIGDSFGVNDDFFGILALVAGNVDAADIVLTDSVNFIISNQNSDGGWGYAVGVGSDSNDTAAAIQALVAAKEHGVANAGLDDAISKAKTYLLSTQDASGGFLYDKNPWTTTPDSNSTSWALLALNVLGMKDSTEGNLAKSWLLSQQSQSDGGFMACQYDPPDYICQLVSNSTVTADTLVGLAGKGWVIKIYDPSAQNPAPTIAPTSTPTPTSSPNISNNPSASTSTPTLSPTPTISPTVFASLLDSPLAQEPEEEDIIEQTTSVPNQEVLGAETELKNNHTASWFFAGLGIFLIFIYIVKTFIIKK